MNDFLTSIINWSEVWSLLIPLTIIWLYKPTGQNIKPLVLYIFIALVLNTMATIMVEFYFSMPAWLKNNNILYNIHSFIRVLIFGWYIIRIRQYRFPAVLKILLLFYLIFVISNFIFIESPLYISSRLFAAESVILLILSLSFFFRSMQDETEMNWLKHPAFLVCTGIILYEATSFFIFLFFYPLVEKNKEFGDLTMSIHNAMYVILCIMVALAFYRSRKEKQIKTGARQHPQYK